MAYTPRPRRVATAWGADHDETRLRRLAWRHSGPLATIALSAGRLLPAHLL